MLSHSASPAPPWMAMAQGCLVADWVGEDWVGEDWAGDRNGAAMAESSRRALRSPARRRRRETSPEPCDLGGRSERITYLYTSNGCATSARAEGGRAHKGV